MSGGFPERRRPPRRRNGRLRTRAQSVDGVVGRPAVLAPGLDLDLLDVILPLIPLRRLLITARAVCGCQPVASISSSSVAPPGRLTRSITNWRLVCRGSGFAFGAVALRVVAVFGLRVFAFVDMVSSPSFGAALRSAPGVNTLVVADKSSRTTRMVSQR